MQRSPAARSEPIRETYFGQTIEDPYRWMEDWQGDEARAWVAAQGEYARRLLDALPERATLLGRVQELTAASATVLNVHAAGGSIFYLRRDPGDNVPKLVTRAALDGGERVLFDPNALSDAASGAAHTVIDWYAPSRDGQLVAYGVSRGGSEESSLHLLDARTGERLDLAIPLTRFDNVSWLADNRSFIYHRMAEPPPGAPLTERYFDSQTYLHRLGGDWRRDAPIFGRGVSRGVTIDRADFPFVATTPESPYMIGLVLHGVLNELTLYAAPASALADPADPAAIAWTKIADVDDAVTGFTLRGETIYLLTHQGAPRYKVIATALARPDLAAAQVIVPESRVVIEDVRVAGDALLIRDLDAGLGRLRRIPLAGGAPQPVALPFEGTIVEWGGEPGSPEVFLLLTSWTESPRVFRYDARTGDVTDTGIVARSPVDFSQIETHEVHASGKDGTLIPLSVLHKKGLPRDGSNPTLLTGYGSYGISLRPTFLSSLLAWLERGGIYATAHLRGGGEYGKDWHEAGRKLTKQTTIDDFIACAEYLIAQGYTRPERLAGEGTSAGGIPSGGALVQRPELWAAMVMRVAALNMLRFEFSENGPPNVPEFGSLATEEGFRALQIIDAYTKVRDSVAYPAALLTTGLNDPRVVVWQAAKMAARLQAATNSDRSVLLRVEGQGGHGIGAAKRQLDEELADKYAFLLWQLGITGTPDERPDEA